MAENVNLGITLQIRNVSFQKLASEQIRKQLSKDISEINTDTGGLLANFNQINAASEKFSRRISTIARLVDRGFDLKDQNVKAFFDSLDKGGQVAVTRLVTLRKALRDLQTGSIDADVFNEIVNTKVLPDNNLQAQQAKEFNSLVRRTIDEAGASYERLTLKIQSENAKQLQDLEKSVEDQKRIFIEGALAEQKAREKARVSSASSAVSGDTRINENEDQTRIAELRRNIQDRAAEQAATESLRQRQAGAAAQLDIARQEAENATRIKTLREDILARAQEAEDSARRLNVLEEKNREVYDQQLRSIIKRQALAKETLAGVGERLRQQPSQEFIALSNFANADPRSLVNVSPPGGGPPRPPVAGGGSEDFFSDDDAARRTVTRLRSIVAQQGKFNGLVQRFGELTGLAAKRYGAFLLGTFAITRLTSAFAAANQEALVFERLIGRLSQTIRVFNDTTEQARSRGLAVGDAILEAGRRTGVASNEIAQGVVEIAQAGNEQLGALQFVADQLANTQLSASFDDIKSTAEGLIAVQGQFNLQLSDTGNLLDKINQVSVEYAVESGNFFEAVKRGGATFAGLGGTFEEFIEYLTLIRSATRETAPTLGVFFKTGLGRLSKSAQQQIFSEFGVDAPGQGRSVIDQLRDLANNQQFQSLSDTERIRTTIALFGAQQAGRGEALLRELGRESGRERTVQDAIGESSGSVSRDIKVVEEDVGRSIGRITQSFQSLFNVLLQDQSVRKFFSSFADALTAISNFASNNRETLNFIVRLTAGVIALSVAFQGLKFVKGLNLGLTGGIGAGADSSFSAGGFRNSRFGRFLNRQNAARIGAVGGIAALGIGGFVNDRLNSAAVSNGLEVSTNQRILSGGLNGAALGASIGLLVGPIGAAVGAAVGGLIGAISENTSSLRELARSNLSAAFNNASRSGALGFRQQGLLSEAIRDSAQSTGFFTNLVNSGGTGQSFNPDNLRNIFRTNNSDFVTLSSQVLRQSNFEVDASTTSEQFARQANLALVRFFNDTLDPGRTNLGIQSVVQEFVNKFINDVLDSEKELNRIRTSLANDSAIKDFDTSILEDIFQNLQSAARGFELNLKIVNSGFDRLSQSLSRIITDFTSLRQTSLASDDVAFRNSVGVNLSNITSRRNSFVDQANFLLGTSGTTEGSAFRDEIPLLIKSLREVELPTQGAAAELDVVQNIENLVNTTLSGFSKDVRASVIDVLGTIKASTGDLQSALQIFLSADFDPSKFADNAFQLEKITQSLRESFGKFVENVNLLSQKTLENNTVLQQLFSERSTIERQIVDSLISTNENRITSVSDRNVSDVLGNFFASSSANRSNFSSNFDTSNIGRELNKSFSNLVAAQREFSRLESSGASPQVQAQQELIVTDNIIKYNDALRLANERQTDLTRSLDLVNKAIGSFQDALNTTRGGLRSLGQVALQADPAELRNQGSLLEGFRRFITGGSGSLDENIRSSVGRLGSTEQAQSLIKALENVANLPIARDAGGLLTGQDAINILLEEIGLRSFGTASGRGRSGRNEIEELLNEQRENLKQAQEAEARLREEQIGLQKDLLKLNQTNIEALEANSSSLAKNTTALEALKTVLQEQITTLNSSLVDPERTSNILNANLQVQVDDIKVSFDTQNLSQFGQNAVADALNRVGQVLTDLYIDEPEKLAKVKLLNVQANRIT